MGSWRSGGTPRPLPPGFPRPLPFGGLRSARTGQMRGPFSSPPPRSAEPPPGPRRPRLRVQGGTESCPEGHPGQAAILKRYLTPRNKRW